MHPQLEKKNVEADCVTAFANHTYWARNNNNITPYPRNKEGPRLVARLGKDRLAWAGSAAHFWTKSLQHTRRVVISSKQRGIRLMLENMYPRLPFTTEALGGAFRFE